MAILASGAEIKLRLPDGRVIDFTADGIDVSIDIATGRRSYTILDSQGIVWNAPDVKMEAIGGSVGQPLGPVRVEVAKAEPSTPVFVICGAAVSAEDVLRRCEQMIGQVGLEDLVAAWEGGYVGVFCRTFAQAKMACRHYLDVIDLFGGTFRVDYAVAQSRATIELAPAQGRKSSGSMRFFSANVNAFGLHGMHLDRANITEAGTLDRGMLDAIRYSLLKSNGQLVG